MSVKSKITAVSKKLKAAGMDVRNPDFDPKGTGNIRWIYSNPLSREQIGAIHPSSNASDRIHVFFEQ